MIPKKVTSSVFVPGVQITMTASISPISAVEWFIHIHDAWFTEERNSMFGKRDELRKLLIDYVEGKEVNIDTENKGYIMYKFTEWIVTSWEVV